MANFRTYGNLDDVQSSEGDRGFTKFVTRRRAGLLQPSELAWSQNGRMREDGTWQVRGGTVVFSEALSFEDVLRLPFDLDDDGTPPELTDNNINGVFGSCNFSDPITEEEYILIATNAFAVLQSLERTVGGDPVKYILPYPGGNIEQTVEPIQLLDRVRLFRGVSAVTWEWSGVIPSLVISAAVRATDTVTITTSTNHGLTSGQYVYIQGLDSDPDGMDDGTYQITVTAPTTFTLLNSGADNAGMVITPDLDYYVSLGFVAVASGTYTQPVVLNGSNNTVVSNGVATVTETAHGLDTGDKVVIISPSTAAQTAGFTEGTIYQIKRTGANTFTFQVEATNGTYHIGYSKRQSVGGGYIHQPNAAWGVPFQGRLVVPYTVNNNDELLFSDIFDADTFDPIFNQFRPASGSADFLVGVQPWVDDRLMVLNRRSIHVINGLAGSLVNASVREITRSVGCVARRTVVSVGDNVLWLSDNGVQIVNTSTEYNPLAVAMPLSDPIQDVFDGINWEHADKSVAVYFDNRYYLAVPVEGGSMPNIVLVYNFLNGGWESIDTFSVGGVRISNMFLARYRNTLRLFFVTDLGAVHLYEEPNSSDQLSIEGGTKDFYTIEGRIQTRDYFYTNNTTKRFARCQVHTKQARVSRIEALMSQPANEVVLLDTPYNTDADGGIKRLRISTRGYGVALRLAVDYGKVESVIVDAILSERSTKDS